MEALKLQPGYAETSSKPFPKEPSTVIVGEEEIANAVHDGQHFHRDGNPNWQRFKVKGKRRYYFQLRLA